MMRFNKLVPNLPTTLLNNMQQDSRLIKKGDLFIAAPGINGDGRKFIADAVKNGAAAIIYESYNFTPPNLSIPCVGIANLAGQLPFLAAKFYDYPSHKLTTIGVTGTNGKTSISQLLAQALDLLDVSCGIVGTLGYGFYPNLTSTNNTTPGVCELQQILAYLVKKNAKACAMEVSSHALEQNRVQEVDFDLAVFSNLSRDHLDYHGDMASYAAAKAKLFAYPNLRAKVINLDDEFGKQLAAQAQNNKVKTITYSLKSPKATIFAANVMVIGAKTHIYILAPDQGVNFVSSLLGSFNVSNLLAVIGAAYALGFDLSHMLDVIPQLQAPVGRMQCLGSKNTPQVVVDYAHTPDALAQALQALRAHTKGKLICVFGCGGNRDKGKRAQMAQMAQSYADAVIVTADNSRFEDTNAIMADIKQGFTSLQQVKFIADRSEAIFCAIENAQMQDLVLIAGKGHENYQEVQGVKSHFSDIEQASMALKNWSIN